MPLLILTTFPFTVVLCIFEKFTMRSLCSMWHTSILFSLLLFLTLPHVRKTRSVLSEQIIILLHRFGSYSSDRRVGVHIPRTLFFDGGGKDDYQFITSQVISLVLCIACEISPKAEMSSLE